MWLLFLVIIIVVILMTVKLGGKQKKEGHFYVGQPWFSEMMTGAKKIDIRPGKEGKHDSLIGQTITYFHKQESFEAKITKINHYKSYKELVKGEKLKDLAGGICKNDTELIDKLSKYHDPDTLALIGGVNAIFFEKV